MESRFKNRINLNWSEMKQFYNEKISELEIVIDEVEIETDCSLYRLETVIHLVLECLSELKAYILKRGFKNINEEILFFKFQKPIIVAKLIYYNVIYKIETRKPYEAKPIRKYLNRELKKTQTIF